MSYCLKIKIMQIKNNPKWKIILYESDGENKLEWISSKKKNVKFSKTHESKTCIKFTDVIFFYIHMKILKFVVKFSLY